MLFAMKVNHSNLHNMLKIRQWKQLHNKHAHDKRNQPQISWWPSSYQDNSPGDDSELTTPPQDDSPGVKNNNNNNDNDNTRHLSCGGVVHQRRRPPGESALKGLYLIGWSVAATRATRKTKKWLALSPRRRLTDVSRGDNQFARKSRGVGDVAATSPAVGLETRWRLESPLFAETCPRCLRDVSWRLAGSRGKFKHVQFFWRLFPVSSRSRWRLRDISETCWRRHRNVSSVSSRSRRHRRDVSETCWRKIEHVWISHDSPETRLVSRRHLCNQRRPESPPGHHLVSRPMR